VVALRVKETILFDPRRAMR